MIEQDLIEKNKDKLLRILLYKEYKRYVENTHKINTFTDDIKIIETYKYIVLDFYEWLEQILE